MASDDRLAAVLFDMDGTLVDSEKVWSVGLTELATHYGGELSAEFLTLSLRRICSNLVQLEISVASFNISFSTIQFSLDPLPDPMDRSNSVGILPARRCSARTDSRSTSDSQMSTRRIAAH